MNSYVNFRLAFLCFGECESPSGKKEEGQPGSIVFFGIIRHCEHNFHVFSVKKALIRITGSVTHDWRQFAGC